MKMKKAIAVMLPVLAAAALASCRSNVQVTSSVKQLAKDVTGMTAEKAAGIYEMTALSSGTAKSDNALGVEDYVSNILTLGSDGSYSLVTVTKPVYEGKNAEEKEFSVEGIYEISDNGIMEFFTGKTDEKGKKEKAYIAASDEQVFYNDAEGKIIFGGSVIKMEYTRESALDEEERAVEAPADEDTAEQ